MNIKEEDSNSNNSWVTKYVRDTVRSSVVCQNFLHLTAQGTQDYRG